MLASPPKRTAILVTFHGMFEILVRATKPLWVYFRPKAFDVVLPLFSTSVTALVNRRGRRDLGFCSTISRRLFYRWSI
jgi:hypothetical protein